MQFYYFTKQHYGLAAIRDERLKISEYKSLNDPFDFIGIATTSSQDRESLKSLRAKLGETAGIICFSDRWKEPLMWGHYADAHKGICLGFTVDSRKYERIQYVAQRPRLEDFEKTSVSRLSPPEVKAISLKKFNRWEYESEWRRLVKLDEQDFVDGNYFMPFDESMKLSTVLFGERSTITDKQITGILKKNNEVKLAFTRAAYSKFDVILDQIRSKEIIPDERRAKQRFDMSFLARLQRSQTNPKDIEEDPEY